MMEREMKRLLKLKIKKQLLVVMELPNHKATLANIESLIRENPETNKDVHVFTTLVDNKARKKSLSLRQSSILIMAGFLWKYEGTYMLCVDVLCYILIANGHDLFNPIKRQYVESLEEIGEVDQSTKLKFLERHDFGMLIRKQDQKLRNKIAHHEYSFDDAGYVRLGNENINIFSRFSDFAVFAGDAFIILCECLEESPRPAKRRRQKS